MPKFMKVSSALARVVEDEEAPATIAQANMRSTAKHVRTRKIKFLTRSRTEFWRVNKSAALESGERCAADHALVGNKTSAQRRSNETGTTTSSEQNGEQLQTISAGNAND